MARRGMVTRLFLILYNMVNLALSLLVSSVSHPRLLTILLLGLLVDRY